MHWLIKLVFVAISELLIAAVEYFAKVINNVFDFMYKINQSLNLDKASEYTLGMGLSLVALFAVKQCFDVYVLHTDGDPDADPLELITRLIVTITTIMCGQWGIQYLVKIASQLATEVVSTVQYRERTLSDIFLDAFVKFISMGTVMAVIQMALFSIVLFSFFLFLIKAAKRGTELILFQLFIPLIAVNLLTTDRTYWNAFKHELLICVFGYIVQLFCFNVFMSLFAQVMTVDGLGSDPKVLIAAYGWLTLVIKAPKWLQKFMYQTGVGNAAKSGIRSAVTLIPQFIKK